ncbi:putative nucleoporin NUP54 complex subunit [Elsinoe australis]|uniref:Putative nucleoporin NUP54 complex subunit n=1 Tax=Elsinoe australis TaxID=40998 RepID=A0A4U7ARD0_9PEZI|nr:putative nucleoporin NUP54 complex subunit [Elsinoe australis]
MSLFGNPPAQQQGTSLFGSSLNQGTQQNKPLFGATTTQNQTSQPQQTTSLFGSLGQTQNQQQNPQQQQQPQQGGSSLFGGNRPAGTPSLFGQPQQQQQQQQQQNAQQPSGGSLFGGGMGASTQNANPLGASLLNNSTSQAQQLMAQSQLAARLAETMKPREKSIPEQMELLLRRWSPESPQCQMQAYFYNSVPPGTAPFWQPGPEDDEQKWEEALSKKPSENTVPVLARGFQQLGLRLRMQVQAVQQLQTRLHEMNNSLEAMMQNHELSLSVRAAEAKRRHVGLSQKCLGLAIKVQVLRSRGFVMDGAEEELRRKLEGLERKVFDPGFAGREEEIWARMVALRERTGWLQKESEKLGRQIDERSGGISEEVLAKVKKILNDYDVQITHLRKELEQVQLEYKEWETSQRGGS